MANDYKFTVSASVERAEQEVRKLQATGQQVTSVLEQSFERLGLQSTLAVEAQRAAYVADYERIRLSGVSTWQEIQTAHAAMTSKIAALDASLKPQGLKSFSQNVDDIGSAVDRLTPRFAGLILTLGAFYIGSQLWEGFKHGVQAVDDFQQSVVKTSAIITSLQGGKDIASNYQQAKLYAAGLNDVLMQVDSRTTLNLQNLQTITEEMIKQGVVLDYTNKDQVEGFTRLANAVAVYSRNGADERQLRQEVSALLRGQVDESSQLSSMLQRTVDGPLKQQVEKWKQSGTIVTELGSRLAGFGPAADDLATSWGAVKSSLETSLNLVMRAGFTDIVKDIAGWLGKINDYLKTHREEIGGKIKAGWEDVKKIMSDAAAVAKFVYNNFEPFAALFVGGVLLSSMMKVYTVFKDIRDLALATRAAMAGIGLASAGAGAAGAAGAAAGGAAGGGLLAGSLAGGGAAIAGLGLGYGLQPAVRWVDQKLYNNFGINLTGEAMYNQEQQRNSEADARSKFFQSENANSAQNRVSGNIPKLSLGDTQQQIKEKIELQDKELAAFKAGQEAKTAAVKEQTSVQMSVLKSSYDQGLVSTQAYYGKEKEVALEAAQQRFENAAAYLRKEQDLLDYVASKKGEKSPEYQEELTKNRKAVSEMQSAQLNYASVFMDTEEKMRTALQSREAEYAKLKEQMLDDAGDFKAAEMLRQTAYRKTREYLLLEADALAGNADAWQAMMALEQKETLASLAAQQKKTDALRQYAVEIANLQDRVDELNGKDQEIIKTGASMRAGLQAEADLRSRLATAWAQGNQAAVSALSTEIQLQQELNDRLQREIDLRNRKMEMTGEIVGYNGDTPIYANGYENEQKSKGYVPNSQLTGSGTGTGSKNANNSPFVPLNSPVNGWTPLAVGTNYVPYDNFPALLHKGEAVVPAKYNTLGASGNTTFDFSGMNIITQGSGPIDTDALVETLARKMSAKLAELNRRKRVA